MSLSQFDTHSNQMEGFDIKQYMAVIRSRKWLIMSVTALVVIVALAFSYQQKPVYESEAQVLVKPIAQSGDQTDFETLNLETEVLIATSPDVALLAAPESGVSDGAELLRGLEVSSAQDTEVLLFRYSHSDPEVARERAQAFAQAYVDHRAETALGNLDDRAKSIQAAIATLKEQVRPIEEQIAATGDPVELENLQTEAEPIRTAISLEQFKLLDIASQSNQDLGRVLYPGYLPTRPSSPNHSKTGAIALLAGLALGVGAASSRTGSTTGSTVALVSRASSGPRCLRSCLAHRSGARRPKRISQPRAIPIRSSQRLTAHCARGCCSPLRSVRASPSSSPALKRARARLQPRPTSESCLPRPASA